MCAGSPRGPEVPARKAQQDGRPHCGAQGARGNGRNGTSNATVCDSVGSKVFPKSKFQNPASSLTEP